MSIQQVGRELPSLAYGPKVFFSAISNNLPILADEIKRARIEYDLLKNRGSLLLRCGNRLPLLYSHGRLH